MPAAMGGERKRQNAHSSHRRPHGAIVRRGSTRVVDGHEPQQPAVDEAVCLGGGYVLLDWGQVERSVLCPVITR